MGQIIGKMGVGKMYHMYGGESYIVSERTLPGFYHTAQQIPNQL